MLYSFSAVGKERCAAVGARMVKQRAEAQCVWCAGMKECQQAMPRPGSVARATGQTMEIPATNWRLVQAQNETESPAGVCTLDGPRCAAEIMRGAEAGVPAVIAEWQTREQEEGRSMAAALASCPLPARNWQQRCVANKGSGSV